MNLVSKIITIITFILLVSIIGSFIFKLSPNLSERTKNIKIYVSLITLMFIVSLFLNYSKTNDLLLKKKIEIIGGTEDGVRYKKQLDNNQDLMGLEFSYTFWIRTRPDPTKKTYDPMTNRGSEPEWVHVWHKGHLNENSFNPNDITDSDMYINKDSYKKYDYVKYVSDNNNYNVCKVLDDDTYKIGQMINDTECSEQYSVTKSNLKGIRPKYSLVLDRLCKNNDSEELCVNNPFCKFTNNTCKYKNEIPTYIKEISRNFNRDNNISPLKNNFMSIVQSPGVWYNRDSSELFININSMQNPLNYVNIPLPPSSIDKNGRFMDIWSFVAIVVKNNKSMEDNTISPMYRKKNYTMEVYVNIDSSNDTLYNIDLNKDSQNFKNYKIVNKGIPLLNDGEVYINQYESTEIKMCDLTYYNYSLNIADIMNMVRSGNMCSKQELKKISKPSTVSSPSDSYFI